MPVKLPNGLVIVNATPHPLHFLCRDGEVVTAETDEVINAVPLTKVARETKQYTLNTVAFLGSPEGFAILRRFREEEPRALVVGSIVAAQAYPGEVVAPIPVQSSRYVKVDKSKRLVRSDRFTVFQPNKEILNNGC